MFWDIALGANKVVGVIVMMICAYKWSAYLATLHENHFWFSNIKVWFSTYSSSNEAYHTVIFLLQEVEREISFRTESGLGRIQQLTLLDSDLDNFTWIHLNL